MAYVHEQPFPGQPDRDPIQVSASTETQTTTEGTGLPPRRRHRGPWLLALAVTVVVGGGGAAAFGLKGKGSAEADPTAGKGGTAGGLAPAVSPSRHGTASGVAGTRGTAASPTSSKGKKSAAPAGPATHSTTPSANYDNKATFDCAGLDVTKSGTTLHVKPKITKHGNPNPAKFVTIADYIHGLTTDSDNEHHVYSAAGLGSSVDVTVPSELDWQHDAATVFVAYYPGGTIPTDPETLSIQNRDTSRVVAACGNAVTTWAAQSGQLANLGGHG